MARSGLENDTPLRYYRVEDDTTQMGRRILGALTNQAGEEIDARVFTEGRRANLETPLFMEIDSPGKPLDFTFGAFDLPVATVTIGECIEALNPGAVQRVPVNIEYTQGEYEILNFLSVVPCLDEQQSVVKWWTDKDNRPDKVGQYRMVKPDMVITASKALGQSVFRVKGWEIALIVSEEVKQALENLAASGVKFRLLTTS